MAGAQLTVTLDAAQVQAALQRLTRANISDMLANIGERMTDSTKKRFADQRRPDGEKWQELKPAYRRRKKYKKDKILTLRGYLSGNNPGQGPHWQMEGENAVAWGVSVKYGAIHQFGGTIEQLPQSRKVRYKSVAGRTLFAKKTDKSGVTERWTTRGAYQVKIPARPFLGISVDDEREVLDICKDWLLDPGGK